MDSWSTGLSTFLLAGGPDASGLSRHLDHDLVLEVMGSNPTIAKKFINLIICLFIYLFQPSVSHQD